MKFFRCKCGKHTAWSSMGVEPCSGCADCKTTLAESPEGHSDIAPHDWQEEWRVVDQTNGRSALFVRCRRCNVSGEKAVMVPAEVTAP